MSARLQRCALPIAPPETGRFALEELEFPARGVSTPHTRTTAEKTKSSRTPEEPKSRGERSPAPACRQRRRQSARSGRGTDPPRCPRQSREFCGARQRLVRKSHSK